ncbi:tripartite tricarboxylate transporter substrate binding protein [Candidimonas sp. SYP-B2681]|nr:tripartite tricarboxylate transporter substrate binding protein [Candidimonas sp. SYP-B2681]
MLAGICMFGSIVGTSAAAAYPDRALTMIVPFAAGGPTDVLARVIADGMSRELGQTVIVENAPGAGGTVGSSRAARAPGDGYTLLIGNVGTLAANVSLYKKLPFDVLRDFTPIGSVGDAPQIVSARPDLSANGLDEFATYLKTHSAQMNAGSAGVGSGSFLGALILNSALGEKVEIVNYRGAGQALTDVMAGHIDYMVDSSTTSVSAIQAGKARGIAVLRATRIKALPDVPAAGESSYSNLHYDIWNMVLAPSATPKDKVARLGQALQSALRDPAVAERLAASGIEMPATDHQTPDGAAKLLQDEIERWRPLVSGLNIALD